jgi:hypothetical protein
MERMKRRFADFLSNNLPTAPAIDGSIRLQDINTADIFCRLLKNLMRATTIY